MVEDSYLQRHRDRSYRNREDLGGRDFSHADIRGADFTNAYLVGANFSNSKTGLQPHWLVGLAIFTLLLSVIAGCISGFIGILIVRLPIPDACSNHMWFEGLLSGAISLFACVFACLLLIQKGAKYALSVFSLLLAGAIILALVIASNSLVHILATAIVQPLIVAGILTGIICVAIVWAVVVTIFNKLLTFTFIAPTFFLGAISGIHQALDGFTRSDELKIFILLATCVLLFALFNLSVYIGVRIQRGDEQYHRLQTIALYLSTRKGTSFRGADLTNANFTNAILKHADLTSAILKHTRWYNARNLDHSLTHSTYLENPKIRNLVVTGYGEDGEFEHLDLHGVNLQYARLDRAKFIGAKLNGADLKNAQLSSANFTEADISGADLENARLEDASLIKTQALETNFHQAILTGACLEAWNINSKTALQDVDCKYVFLLEKPNNLGSRERLPHNPDKIFRPGDFEKYFKEVLDTVQILIRDGINPEAFKLALQSILNKYSDTTVESIEKQDQDVLLTLKVAEGVNKGEVERDWDQVYQTRLKAQKDAALLESEQRHNADLRNITLATVTSLGSFLSNLTINATAMTDSNNPNISATPGSFINTGNLNATGSTFNLGEISGNVTNTINQLQATATPAAAQLAALLKELQDAIETSELPPADKTEALEQVNTLAKAGQNPQDDTLKKLSGTAVKVIKGTIAALPDTAKLVEACGKLLPVIISLLGL
jgi:uncharacterized protein YjbI with pentapeptide repeats